MRLLFDALITVDKNTQYQQNLSALPLSVVVLNARSNEIKFLVPFVPKLELALAKLYQNHLFLLSYNQSLEQTKCPAAESCKPSALHS